MKYSYCLGGDPLLKTVKIGATVTAGQPLMRDVTNKYAEAIPCTTTTSPGSLGLAMSGGTYATTAEATVSCVCNPFSVLRAKVSGGATDNTALTVLEQTSASTSVFTDADVGANSMIGGTLLILSGANAGLSRIVTSTSSGVSVTVTVVFPASIAVGDKGIWCPFAIGSSKVQGTTTLQQANGTIASGTGLDCGVIGLELDLPIDTTTPVLWVDFILHDSAFTYGSL